VLEAIVLVGGQGTRLRPLTLTTPKPLLPVAGVPFLAHQFARLRDVGVTRIILATSYRADLFEEVFAGGDFDGVELIFVTEAEPMGTGGAIANAAAALESGPDDPVIVFNGDVLSGHDLSAQLAVHLTSGAEVTLHLVEVDDARRFGCVPTDASGRVTDFLEKMPNPVSHQINAGCYIFKTRVISTIPTARPVSVERETFPNLLQAGAHIQAYVETAYWLDLGTPATYVQGSSDLVTGAIASTALPGAPGQALVLDGAQVSSSAQLVDGSVVGTGAHIGDAAIIRSVIFDDAQVGSGVRLVDCLVGFEAVIGDGSQLERCVIGDGAVIPAGQVLRDSRLWNQDGGLTITSE
jgi:mannose-1-phosphate guanylyltransferase